MSLPSVLHLRHSRRTPTSEPSYNDYTLTLRQLSSGDYEGTWHYPQLPGRVNVWSGWTEAAIIEAIERGDWVYDYPDSVRVPEGL